LKSAAAISVSSLLPTWQMRVGNQCQLVVVYVLGDLRMAFLLEHRIRDLSPFEMCAQRIQEVADGPAFFFLIGESTKISRVLSDLIYLHRLEFLGDEQPECINIIVDSAGGDIAAAYKLIHLFRGLCRQLKVYVLRQAKSAATFLCLGADEIVMCENAELGPLDVQIEKRGHPDEYESALDQFATLDAVRKYCLETFDLAVQMVIGRTGMDIPWCVTEALKFVAAITGPIYTNVNIQDLGRYRRSLNIAKWYGERVLKEYALYSDQAIGVILEELVEGYPDHEFAIDVHEAKRLGLNAREANEEETEILISVLPILYDLPSSLVGTMEDVSEQEVADEHSGGMGETPPTGE